MGEETRSVGVIVHRGKHFGGGLHQLRRRLKQSGVSDPIWYEVSKSRHASGATRQALEDGAELLFVWGGDGTVQRCVDAAAGKPVDLAILPAGTANLLAANLGIPTRLDDAVEVGLHGARRRLDVGLVNGKRFAVMAGVGLDALIMRDANGRLKDRFGRLAYVWTGARASRMTLGTVRIVVDGVNWFTGQASCILFGIWVRSVVSPFPHARPDHGLLEVGVSTAQGPLQWTRVLTRMALRQGERSPLTKMTRARTVDVELDEPTVFQLDGGVRKPRRHLRASVEPDSISVCVPLAKSGRSQPVSRTQLQFLPPRPFEGKGLGWRGREESNANDAEGMAGGRERGVGGRGRDGRERLAGRRDIAALFRRRTRLPGSSARSSTPARVATPSPRRSRARRPPARAASNAFYSSAVRMPSIAT